jgi:serine/threonine-protein kinase
MSLGLGTRIGPYEIVSAIGAGGMGEVYRATDTNLGRQVAIKVLPEALASDPERLARFEREAKTLAALNHPNIAQIYGLERSGTTPALVMELVEGETLADRIARGPIPLDETLPIAKQIAEALEAAHEQGIIHRDLKPANIKVRPDGTVKVLDFGLAKLAESSARTRTSDLSLSPTITSPAMTGVGVLLGTAAYMAPEQAKGRPADKRSDIWAFGCVLYEMLTGERAFDGDDVSDTLAAVLRSEPDWARLPANLPPLALTLLRDCLKRDPRWRVSDISTALFVFRREANLETSAPRSTSRLNTTTVTAAAIAGLVVALGAAYVIPRGTSAPTAVTRLSIPLAATGQFTQGSRRLLTLSPDGSLLVYDANNRLYVRRLDQLEAIPIRGIEGSGNGGPRNPFFSPNGQWIGFWQDGQLKKVSVSGGPPVAICQIAAPYGLTWSADNTILIGGGPSGVWRVSADGGTPENIIKLKAGQVARSPQLMPDGRTILFTVATTANWDDGKIVVQSLDGGAVQTVVRSGTDGLYIPTGHIAYAVGETLLAVPFDAKSLTVVGGPVSLVEAVAGTTVTLGNSPSGVSHFAVSDQGTLAYVPYKAVIQQRSLVWVDRNGREELLNAPPRAYQYPRISPDATRVALDIRDQETDIWIWDFARETLTRLTFGPSRDLLPVWTPDSRRIAYVSERDGRNGSLYWQSADGTGAVERLTENRDGEGGGGQVPYSFTPDGSKLLYRFDTSPPAKTGADLWVMTINGRRSEPLLQSPFNERHGELSADGRWLAYVSDESGRNEVFVRPFPDANSGRWQVSTAGGSHPLWSRSGEELFFLSPAGEVMGVRITRGSIWSAGAPTKLVDAHYYTNPGGDRTYDVAPDGRRFLMSKNSSATTQTSVAPQIVVVQGWFDEVKRLVPRTH